MRLHRHVATCPKLRPLLSNSKLVDPYHRERGVDPLLMDRSILRAHAHLVAHPDFMAKQLYIYIYLHVDLYNGNCQNYGPFLGPLN